MKSRNVVGRYLITARWCHWLDSVHLQIKSQCKNVSQSHLKLMNTVSLFAIHSFVT